MLRFFRHIRQRLLRDNKFSKYLLYAVGEILLVVIGILIALQVDNWNQERENKEKVKAILSDLMVELESNIEETTRVMKFYEQKDSTIFLSITNQLTEDNFRNNKPGNLFSLTTLYTRANLSNEAWFKLMDISDIIPEEYKSIISSLNRLYNVSQARIIQDNDLIDKTTSDYYNYLAETYPWFTPRSSKDGSRQKEIEYRLNSVRHRNNIKVWFEVGVANHLGKVLVYRQNALEAYDELAELLNTPKSDDVYFDPLIAEKIKGIWRSERFPGYKTSIEYSDGRVLQKFNQDLIPGSIFKVSDSKLIIFPPFWYYNEEMETWSGSYPIRYYTIIQKDDELIIKDYFSEWSKVSE